MIKWRELMIDYLIVIYKNYKLLDLQIENFKKNFLNKDYRLIVVDNTPDIEKQEIKYENEIDVKVIVEDSHLRFDGVSHGQSIDIGLQYCDSPIVCLIDSDFFFLKKDIHEYAKQKFSEGYVAFGTEYNDGCPTSFYNQPKFKKDFENVPSGFGSFWDNKLIKSDTWVITEEECNELRETGYNHAGWRIRKNHIGMKTFTWKTDINQYGNCFFKDENGELMGFHYVGGSHRRWNENSYSEIQKIINGEY